jgi:hypothetical protein
MSVARYWLWVLEVNGHGPAPGLSPVLLANPLDVQLQRNGQCWATTFSAAGVNTNGGGQFKGKSD